MCKLSSQTNFYNHAIQERPVLIENIVQGLDHGYSQQEMLRTIRVSQGAISKNLQNVRETNGLFKGLRRHRRTFELPPCNTQVILDISLWESPWPDNRMMISIITGWILIGMISSDSSVLNAININATLCLGNNWGNQHSQGKGWSGLDRNDGRP